MKKLLLIICTCMFFYSANSQSIQFIDLVNDISTQTGSDAVTPLRIKNNSKDPLRISISKISSDLTSSQKVLLCYNGICNTGANLDIITIPPGETLKALDIKFSSGLDESESNVKFLLVDVDNPQKTIYQTFSYSVRSQSLHGTLYSKNGINVSEAYPNPAFDYTTIDYNLNFFRQDAKIILHNVLGEVISQYSLSSGTSSLKIPTDDLKVGVYFYTLNLGNKGVVTKKLIVGK